MSTAPNTISRRRVTAGLAWSVPAVAVAASAPAFAASPDDGGVVVTAAGAVLKYPGNSAGEDLVKAYGVPVTFTNDTDSTVTVTPATFALTLDQKSMVSDGTVYTADPCQGGSKLQAGADEFVLAPGESITLFLVVDATGNSANESGCLEGTFAVASEDGTTDTAQLTGACFSDTPPNAAC